jgi:hypothetical protein
MAEVLPPDSLACLHLPTDLFSKYNDAFTANGWTRMRVPIVFVELKPPRGKFPTQLQPQDNTHTWYCFHVQDCNPFRSHAMIGDIQISSAAKKQLNMVGYGIRNNSVHPSNRPLTPIMIAPSADEVTLPM